MSRIYDGLKALGFSNSTIESWEDMASSQGTVRKSWCTSDACCKYTIERVHKKSGKPFIVTMRHQKLERLSPQRKGNMCALCGHFLFWETRQHYIKDE